MSCKVEKELPTYKLPKAAGEAYENLYLDKMVEVEADINVLGELQ